MITAAEWLITGLGFLSSWLLGRRNRYGWVAGVAVQIIWLYVATATRQWAFVPASFVYGALALRGWRTWSKKEVSWPGRND
jgi:hypothetical protein